MRIPKKLIDNLVENSNDIGSTDFSISNNQSTPANITGFAFNNSNVRSFEALVSVEVDASSNLYESFKVLGIQKEAGWNISISGTGDESQIELSITSSGQMQYTSANYSGFVSGTIKFRSITTEI